MRILIVEAEQALGRLWSRHLSRAGHAVTLAGDLESAIVSLSDEAWDMIVLDLDLTDDGALTVAAFAEIRQPDAGVIFVTSQQFFSDGSIFALSRSARAFVSRNTVPGDLVALIEHNEKL